MYIANVFDSLEVNRLKKRRDETNYESKKKKNLADSYDSLIGFKKSVISFDMGSTWHPLKPPSVDSKG